MSRSPVLPVIAALPLVLVGARAARAEEAPPKAPPPLVVTVVYDNNAHDARLTTAWGFGCVVQGLPKTILFDTGGKGSVLLGNMRTLGIKPGDIDVVVLSHRHNDHVGGLGAFLKQNKDVTVFLPATFPERLKGDVRAVGAKVVETGKPQAVCAGARTTGVLGTAIKEQGLCVETPDGLLVITGCAHPGVVHMVGIAKEHSGKPVWAVVGGFHLLHARKTELSGVIKRLRQLGVSKVGPCHCSGKRTRQLMKEAFKENYIELGAGTRITLPRRAEPAKERE